MPSPIRTLRPRVQRRAALLSLAACATLLAGTVQAAAAVGQPAPAFTLTDTSGKTRTLAEFKGKTVVLEWTNPGCPFVRKHYDSANMPGLQKEFTGKDVVWLAVNSTEKAASDYLAPRALAGWIQGKSGAPTATLMDEEGTVGKAYGARTTPHMYIVNPQGTLVYAGGIDSIASARASDIQAATNYVRQGLNETLAGKPISQAQTQPYGCTIKYKS
ncbi:thioredoxin family protein [Pseudorhodoferax sp. Leaf274]|uniref:thioredoxin family protein n=1 Tax=Pseudorhodoferax sp. Leaf274 TaxID=1736318 RepID=UPI0007024B51|nr:thioredoxin family protein [Pseudorhodoferax sp. Leaf274]KQP38089.1 alkyl hydroperoxide reductase [Pseudorhodoferax sp. Leaf274]